MVEAKQVKVDNWGIFFLQRLQQFYSKSSYCDLTLQFEDNVQIKVHRLVMNACTEYFQILEQTCNVEKNCLMMPSNLPSEVVIPIINFMYSGILEFQETLFDRLYSTAKLMNMSVLTKLLDAQKTPIKPPVTRRIQSVTPITWNLQGRKITTKSYMEPDLPETLPGRKLPIWKRKSIPPTLPFFQNSNSYDNYTSKIMKTSSEDPPKPTRFEWPEEDGSFENTFDDISYESKPLILPTFTPEKSPKPSTSSTFEEIKKTAGSLKRSASPLGNQCKKVNIQDVKEYLKEHKIRSDYIDYDDSEMADNDLQSFDDDSNEEHSKETIDMAVPNLEETPNKSILKNESAPCQPIKHVRFSLEGKENEEKRIQFGKSPSKTPVPKPEQNSPDMSKHTKIITEVLKKYPHLVKNNKNIRLKILAKGNGNVTKSTPVKVNTTTKPVSYMVVKPEQNQTPQTPEKEQTWECSQCTQPQTFTTYHTYRQHLTEVHNEKQDSQLCTICGYTSRKQPMLVYHKFIKHNTPPPAMYNFPKCKECAYIAFSPIILQKHMASSHNTCFECNETFVNKPALITHLQQTGHAKDKTSPQWDCKYCDKKFFSENILNTHIKRNHEEQINTEENIVTPETNTSKLKDKIKILSDVKVTTNLPNQTFEVKNIEGEIKSEVQTEQSSEAEALSNVASGIAASLGLVDTIVVLDDNQFILQSQHGDIQQNIINANGNNYILPQMQMTENISQIHQNPAVTLSSDTTQSFHKSGIQSTDELVMVLTDHDYSDGTSNAVMTDNNIVVLYSHPVQTQAGTMMLTSESGMIEVDKNFVQNIPVSLAQSVAPHCEESIEMIQQEINNQLDTNIQIQENNSQNQENDINKTEEIKPVVVYQHVEMKDLHQEEKYEITEVEDTYQESNVINSEKIESENIQVNPPQNDPSTTEFELKDTQSYSNENEHVEDNVNIQQNEPIPDNVETTKEITSEIENTESQIQENEPMEIEIIHEETSLKMEVENQSEKENLISDNTYSNYTSEDANVTELPEIVDQEPDNQNDIPEAAIEKEADQVLKEDENNDLNNYNYITEKNTQEDQELNEPSKNNEEINNMSQTDLVDSTKEISSSIESSSDEYLTPNEIIPPSQEVEVNDVPVQDTSEEQFSTQEMSIQEFTSTPQEVPTSTPEEVPTEISTPQEAPSTDEGSILLDTSSEDVSPSSQEISVSVSIPTQYITLPIQTSQEIIDISTTRLLSTQTDTTTSEISETINHETTPEEMSISVSIPTQFITLPIQTSQEIIDNSTRTDTTISEISESINSEISETINPEISETINPEISETINPEIVETIPEEPIDAASQEIPQESTEKEESIEIDLKETSPELVDTIEQKELSEMDNSTPHEPMEVENIQLPESITPENQIVNKNETENDTPEEIKNLQETDSNNVENIRVENDQNNKNLQIKLTENSDKDEPKEILRNEKISKILDDWDDGDSDSPQSFSKTQTQENENSSINKLIDDWNDEEDT